MNHCTRDNECLELWDAYIMKRFCGVTFVVLLSACASSTTQPVVDPTLGHDPAEAQLAEAATAVSKSLTSLNEIQQAVTPPPSNFQPPDPASYGMANLVSIDWAGPIEPLLTQIANASGYRVRILGKEPAVAIMIYIDEKNKPLGDILRNAGYQCADKANIVVYPKAKVIELRYANT